MFNAKRTALSIAIGAMALAAGEANAGCKYIPNPPGSLVCASWIKGSEICDLSSVGQPASVVNPAKLLSATCSITGAVFIDGAEGGEPPLGGFSGVDGAYCASGNPPPGVCETASGNIVTGGGFPNVVLTNGKPPKKPVTQQRCHPNHDGRHLGKDVGHEDCTINLPGGNPVLSEDASPPVCNETPPSSGLFDCTSSAEIVPPEGTTCPNGLPALDFTATAMLAIAEFCVSDGGSGQICDKVYDICTIDPGASDGTLYNCHDITDQGTRNFCETGSYLTYAPDDPLCGQFRATCSD